MLIRYAQREFIPAPVGLHQAVIVDVVDLGKVTVRYNGKEKIRDTVKVVFQLEELMPSDEGPAVERRFLVARRYTKSLAPRSSLRKDLEAIQGGFSRERLKEIETSGFDTERLIGVNCMLQIVHKKGLHEGRPTTWANVANVLAIAKDAHLLEPDGLYTRVKDREDAA